VCWWYQCPLRSSVRPYYALETRSSPTFARRSSVLMTCSMRHGLLWVKSSAIILHTSRGVVHDPPSARARTWSGSALAV